MERNLKNNEKNFDSDPVFAEKYLKTKTNFNDEAPKRPSGLLCLQ